MLQQEARRCSTRAGRLGVLIPRKESNAMKKAITPLTALPLTGMGAVDKAWDAVSVSFERFCLTAGIEALGTMMEQDAEEACGARHARSDGRRGHRWGRTQGKIGFHAGKDKSSDSEFLHGRRVTKPVARSLKVCLR